MENVKEEEIAILKFKLIQKIGKIIDLEEAAIYVHNTLKISKLDWFKKNESLALKMTDPNNKVFDIIWIYRSPNLNKKDNYILYAKKMSSA